MFLKKIYQQTRNPPLFPGETSGKLILAENLFETVDVENDVTINCIKNNTNLQAISKFLSYVLRHGSRSQNLKMTEDGFVTMLDLLQCLQNNNLFASPNDILNIIKTDAKSRFYFDESKQSIRCNQGHSIKLDLGLKEVTEFDLKILPTFLIHETYAKSLPDILREDLGPMSRLHIHFSLSEKTRNKFE